MAQLKHHLLREIATDLCEREADMHFIAVNSLPSIEKFILAGKEPSRVFRRIVEDYVTVTFVTSDSVRMTYCAFKSVFLIHGLFGPMHREYPWTLSCNYLNNLFIKWTRKLSIRDTKWLYASPLVGYSKVMAENSDLQELWVDGNRFYHNWATILKTFPKLYALNVSAENLSLLLPIASTELAFLEELVLNGTGYIKAAHQVLHVHQSKCPNLDTIRYLSQVPEVRFPDNVTIPSVKHITIKSICYTPWNFAFLTVFQKAFPSLESVEIDVYTGRQCFCSKVGGITEKLKIVDAFYQAFQSLNFGFTIKLTYREYILIDEDQQTDELYPFFMTKGKLSRSPRYFAVESSYPGKQLTYVLSISRRHHDFHANHNVITFFNDYDYL